MHTNNLFVGERIPCLYPFFLTKTSEFDLQPG